MVKAYLKFVQQDVFGVIASTTSLFDKNTKHCITGSGERISIWNLKKQTLERSLFEEDTNSEIATLALSNDGELLAAGHNDGSIRLWSMREYQLVAVFNGHRGSVCALHFNQLGSQLVSGSKDTEIIVWDIITETGLYRLRGHRDMVTAVRLLEKTNRLVSSSKDGLIKIWELETQHCIQTIVGHRNPVWAIDVNADESRLVSVTNDSFIRCWRLDAGDSKSNNNRKYIVNNPINTMSIDPSAEQTKEQQQLSQYPVVKVKKEENSGSNDDDNQDVTTEQEFAIYYGSVPCKGESYNGIKFDPTNRVLIAQSQGKFIDLFQVSHGKELDQKLKKENRNVLIICYCYVIELNVIDEFRHTETIKTPSKVRGFNFGNQNHWNKFVISMMGNQVQAYEIKQEGTEVFSTLENGGHRADVRSLTLSSNDAILASTSSDSVKIWNVKTLNCIRTFQCDYGLCSVFVPGNLHVIVGTKSGTLEVFELASAEHVATVQAHEGALWSMALTPDARGIATCGSDKQVKFWNFKLIANPDNQKTKKLTLVQTQILQLESEAMCVRFSQDKRFLAVSLLDNTVKIFYADTLKFHLSLYGHKLPVMTMDISDDSTLIVTGSADKNIKIWGLDYGDCHKSLFAHDDSIMQVAFIPKTHHVISTSKDKRIKYWDADKFEHIQTLQVHHGEVWSLAMGSVGTFFLTGSHDRSIRTFKQTSEPVFVDSEKQQTLEKEWEATLEDDNRVRTKEMLEEHASANKKTLETIIAGEEILDAVLLAENERIRLKEYQETAQTEDEPYNPNILLFGMSPSDYLWNKVFKVRASDLEEALVVLPYSTLKPLFTYFSEWLNAGKSVELISKCLFFLVQTHQNQLSTEMEMVPLLQAINERLKQRVQKEKDAIGFNRSAMTYLRREVELEKSYAFFEDAPSATTASKTSSSSTAKQSSKEPQKKSKIQTETLLLPTKSTKPIKNSNNKRTRK
ncbi:WD40 repeat-containing protein [Heterostelium album PN500]|uniref:WD40 repeat-containing protein n=1 Tax=Heterostelium pallidum (strain ATCC 26659 / Pp 5 / PN500) TaxID=670386 RepID=D3BE83_HETP5|nr:WD40 repeat-containing protein [Heterostelium album PN500]EFA80214.1 WD40 repeat-containing protein [Heterostelium album PN500]|eukprot:XP_020432334.1 WD40 repeat-containing protein [Heterostelium album PN500]